MGLTWAEVQVKASVRSVLNTDKKNVHIANISCRLFPESPRWFISKGCHDQAEKTLKKIAHVNGCHLPENIHAKDIYLVCKLPN